MPSSGKRLRSSGASGKKRRAAQSAMEYIMTYGWAIVILSVVVVALYVSGVFSSSSAFAPKAQPGSCHVYRPNEPGASSLTSLAGVCNGENPEFTAQFNGQSSGVSVTDTSGLDMSSGGFSVAAWIYWTGSGTQDYIVDKSGKYTLSLNAGNPQFSVGSVFVASPGPVLPPNAWYFLVGTYSGGTVQLYINSKYVASSTSATQPTPGGNLEFGCSSSCSSTYSFSGQISNIQIYNTSLSANEVQALYSESIGGAPVLLSRLAGWWPLNGDTNDYSGAGNSGTSANVAMNGTWTMAASTYSSYGPCTRVITDYASFTSPISATISYTMYGGGGGGSGSGSTYGDSGSTGSNGLSSSGSFGVSVGNVITIYPGGGGGGGAGEDGCMGDCCPGAGGGSGYYGGGGGGDGDGSSGGGGGSSVILLSGVVVASAAGGAGASNTGDPYKSYGGAGGTATAGGAGGIGDSGCCASNGGSFSGGRGEDGYPNYASYGGSGSSGGSTHTGIAGGGGGYGGGGGGGGTTASSIQTYSGWGGSSGTSGGVGSGAGGLGALTGATGLGGAGGSVSTGSGGGGGGSGSVTLTWNGPSSCVP